MTPKILATSFAAFLFTAAIPLTASATVPFERLAPENSVFVVGLHNAATTEERFKRTALHDLWLSDEMRDLRTKFMDEFDEEFEEALREAGVDREDLSFPTGAVGLAVFPVVDPQRGMPSPGFVAYADFGDRADAIERAINAAIERGQREDEIAVEEREIVGRTVRSITPKTGADAGWDDEDDWGFDDMNGFGGGGGDDTFHLVREGGAFIVCNDLGSITEMLDRIEQDQPSGLAIRPDYRAAMDQLGNNDLYAVLLTRDLMRLVSGFDPTGGMMGMLPPVLTSLVGEIHALSTSVLFDAPDGMVRQNMGVYMPAGKRGLTALMDVSTQRGPLPPFLGADVHSYTSMNFAFNRLPEAVQEFVQANQMLFAMMPLPMPIGELLAQIDAPMRQMTGTLGSSIHMIGSATRPYTQENVHTVFALEASDPQQFETMFGGMAAQMGLEGRDFLGHRIYSSGPMMPGMMPGMGMPEFAIGIGAGHIFLGATPGVEQALRAASEPDRAATLAEDAQYRRAVDRIPNVPLVSWSYADMITALEASFKVAQAGAEEMMEQMRRDFPEWAEEMEADAADDPLRNFDFDLLRRHIGPSISWVRSTENGFVGTTLYLAAEESQE